MDINHLTERDIRHMLGRGHAGRGDIYQREGRLQHGRRSEEELSGYCQGSRAVAYRVRVFLKEGRIEATRCECPVGTWCKHTAALLFQWVRQPETFALSESLTQKLHRLSNDALVEIIDQVLQERPELAAFVDVLATTAWPATKREAYEEHVERVQIRDEAEEILASYEGESWDKGKTARFRERFESLLRRGALFAESGRLSDAARYFGALLEALGDHYFDFEGVDQAVVDLLETTTAALLQVYTAMDDPFPRLRVLPDLWETWLLSNYYDGLDLAGPIEKTVSEFACEQERIVLTQWLNEELAQLDDEEIKSEWMRLQATRFLLAMKKKTLSTEEYLAQLNALGDLDLLVPALLEARRPEEAKERLLNAGATQGVGYADLFLEFGYPSVAIELMRLFAAREEGFTGRPATRWLADFFVAHHRPEEALPYARALFEARPTAKDFVFVRSLAEQAGRWQELSDELVEAALRIAPEELIQVYLADGNHAAAIEIWNDVAPSRNPTSELALELAERVRVSFPNHAVEIWAEAADELISRRRRSHYRTACQYLAEIRDVYLQIGRPHLWDELSQWLVEEHRRLPAFRDELKKAGLVSETAADDEEPPGTGLRSERY